jgi:iron complex transport system substrate-binding protein
MRRVPLLGALLLAAACSSTSPAVTAKAITVQAANGPVTLPAIPKRIVSLSPTATEMLYAVGAGKQVVAVDDQSDYPAGVPATKLSGFKPNAEAVIAYKPDLVVLSNDTGGIVSSLDRVKIPVLLEPAAVKIDDVYGQLTSLGTATGHTAQATSVASGMRTQIAAAVQAAPRNTGVSYYDELTSDLYTVTSKTFAGQVFGLFGLHNIADAADKQGTGYPKLSAEALLKADPRLIFLSDTKCCGQSAATVAKRPGWQNLTAVQKNGVVALDDSVASRWGPRLVDLVKAIGAALQHTA